VKNDVEPVIGAIEAYRWFDVQDNELWSIGAGDYVWTPGANRARCHRVGAKQKTRTVWVNDPADPDGLVERKEEQARAHGRIPAVHCQCGFYVLRDEPPLEDTALREVLARVLIWGRAIEHRDGYRAEHAAVTALITKDAQAFSSIQLAYGIPAVRPRTRAEQDITTAFLTMIDGDRVKLDVPTRDTSEVIGWFRVNAGVELPDPVAYVTARFTPDRVITRFRVHPEEEA
jgi:hypothetical protein